jgi:hypothetical protein
LPRLYLPFIPNSLQGDHSPLRDCRRFLECHPGWFLCQNPFRNAHILGKTTPVSWRFPKYVI